MIRRRGVTLLEVLVAGILLSIGLVGAISVTAKCAVTTAGARDRSRAMMFARSKMEEILKEPTLQIGTDQGQGVDESTEYDWAANIEQSSYDGLYVIAVEAKNRLTGLSVILTALRRPDLSPPAAEDGSTTATTGGGTS